MTKKIHFTNREESPWYIEGEGPNGTHLHEKEVVQPTQPQSRKVLKLLKKGHLTRLTAMHYGIMNLTARIADLRALGWVVNCNTKWDSEGNRYGDFTLAKGQS